MNSRRHAASNKELSKRLGFTHYHGQPCGNFASHGTKRYTNSGNCVKCDALKNNKKRLREPRPKSVLPMITEPYTPEQEARLETGALKYYGKPCGRGHDGLRYARNGVCVDCNKERSAKYQPPAGLTRGQRAKWKRDARIERKRQRDAEIRALLAPRSLPDNLEMALTWAVIAV